MSITLDSVTGLLDAEVIDGNFEKLENFLREGVTKEDISGRFGKYSIRRYTGGKLSAFNSGVNRYLNHDAVSTVATFENNWMSGCPEISFVDLRGDTLDYAVTHPRVGGLDPGPDADSSDFAFRYRDRSDLNYSHPLQHPFELLGYPGGSLYYDFQEQGFSDPVSFYAEKQPLLEINNWPPQEELTVKHPDDECWSRWLTVPDAAGSVYVDEPCVAIITAQVTGNYLFTPMLRVHGTNTAIGSTHTGSSTSSAAIEESGAPKFLLEVSGYGIGRRPYSDEAESAEIWEEAVSGDLTLPEFAEGMQNSASIRLGLFVDTNPIVWEDEFKNEGADDSGYNPWIGTDATGAYSAERADGVAKYRSWKKITDITMRVRQRGTYKIIGAVELKGRRKYNFSMKFRPAMTFGHVEYGGPGYAKFTTGYYELSESAAHMPMKDLADPKNPAWYWGSPVSSAGPVPSPRENYFFPGGDALVTNLIESSALSVEFFYGQKLADVIDGIEANVNPQTPSQPGV